MEPAGLPSKAVRAACRYTRWMPESASAETVPVAEDLLRTALAWHRRGDAVAVATVVATWGSAPRQAGSQLVCNSRGDFAGSVSGGCVEIAVIEAARDILAGAPPRVLEFGVSDDEAWAVGLACGGRIRVFVEALR